MTLEADVADMTDFEQLPIQRKKGGSFDLPFFFVSGADCVFSMISKRNKVQLTFGLFQKIVCYGYVFKVRQR